jgi:hypothetical protein
MTFRFISLTLAALIFWNAALAQARPARATAPPRPAMHVLFIDLNNAEDELDAVAHALPKHNASMAVVPSLARFSFKQRDGILKVKAQYDKTAKEAELCTLKGVQTCPPLWAKLRELELERERLTGNYRVEQLIEDLAPHANRSFDVVVISGHHSGGFFRGEIAELAVDDLMRVDATYPQLFRHARTVILLGCETGTPHMFSNVFPVIFPSATTLIGAEDNAPTRSEARNLSFIEAAVALEPHLTGARDANDVLRLHKRLLGYKWPVTILWHGEHYFAKKWHGNIAQAKAALLQAEIDEEDRRKGRRVRPNEGGVSLVQ